MWMKFYYKFMFKFLPILPTLIYRHHRHDWLKCNAIHMRIHTVPWILFFISVLLNSFRIKATFVGSKRLSDCF